MLRRAAAVDEAARDLLQRAISGVRVLGSQEEVNLVASALLLVTRSAR
jgi:hypothetical protein